MLIEIGPIYAYQWLIVKPLMLFLPTRPLSNCTFPVRSNPGSVTACMHVRYIIHVRIVQTFRALTSAWNYNQCVNITYTYIVIVKGENIRKLKTTRMSNKAITYVLAREHVWFHIMWRNLLWTVLSPSRTRLAIVTTRPFPSFRKITIFKEIAEGSRLLKRVYSYVTEMPGL